MLKRIKVQNQCFEILTQHTFFFTIESEISFIQNGNIFKFEHINQNDITSKLIVRRNGSKHIKHIDEYGFDVTSLSDRNNVII